MSKKLYRPRTPNWFGASMRCLQQAVLLLLLCSVLPRAAAQGTVVVPFNQSWKYEQSNIDLGTAWKEPGYDDTTIGWGTGTGPLGFAPTEALTGGAIGTSGLSIQTVLNRTTNGVQPRTYYFRATFMYDGDPREVTVLASNLIDDAAVFWLNGVEVGRPGFNAGTVVTYTSEGNRAASDVTSYGWDVFSKTLDIISGVNTFAVEVHQTGGNSSDLVFASLLRIIPGQPLVITGQPTGGTYDEGLGLNLNVTVTGSNPRYQWYKGTNSPVPVTDGTNATLVFTNAAVADSGDYFVIATNSFNSVTSLVAHLEIVTDTNGPVLLKVSGDDSFQRIILTWNEPVAEGPALEAGNYYILDSMDNQVIVTAVSYNGSNIVLTVPTLAVDADYSIEVDYQTDLVGNPTLPVGMPEVDPANGVQQEFHTWVYTPGLARFQAYLSTTTIAAARTSPLYPDSGSFGFLTNIVYWPQTANPNIDNYVMRFDGLFLAAADGLHKFNPAHDDDFEMRVYPGPSTNGDPTVLSGGCCTDLIAGSTLDVTLTAGQLYYYELLVHEAGGGDYAGIAVTLPDDSVVSPMAGQYLQVATDPSLAPNVGIAQQPQNQTIEDNHSATFSVVVTNGGSSISYQWQREPAAGGGFANIPGASLSVYTTPIQTLANDGDKYRVIVYVPGRNVTSSNALLTVIADTNAPHVLRITTGVALNSILVPFDEVMNAGTIGEPGNFELRDSASNILPLSTPVVSADNRSVTFSTPTLTLGTTYTLHVQDVTDAAGNAIVATDVSFRAGAGLVKLEIYDTSSTPGNAVSLLTSHPNYPSNPREVGLLAGFNSDPYWTVPNTDVSREQYGARMSSWFIPLTSGSYIFYNRSDDASELWLSTDNNPANRVKIQEELGCCNGFSAHASAPQPLVAGNAYYLELLYKEGTGGDFGQIAVKEASDPTPPDSLAPISGAILSAVDPTPQGARINYSRAGSVLTLTWEAPYRLQCATTLSPTADWKDVDTGGMTTYVVDPANQFDVLLDTAQSGGGARTGSGKGTVTLSGNTLIVDVTYSGLSGTWANSHFHAPAARGASTGVAYGTGSIDSGNPGGMAGAIVGTIPLVDGAYGGKNIADQLQDLRSSLWYLNIHTSPTFTGGEIRGQVEPAKTRFYRLVNP